MKLDQDSTWWLVVGLAHFLIAASTAYILYAVLSGGTEWISSSAVAQIWGTLSPRWPFVAAGVLLIAICLYTSVSVLRDFAEGVGLLRDPAVLGKSIRNPFARPVATAVLSNNDLLFPGFDIGDIAGGGVSQVVEFHGRVGNAAVEAALKELQSRLKVPGRFSRQPILLLQVVPAGNEQISTDTLNWVTSCALRVGFASVKTLTGLGRALTEGEFSRMARVLS
jgi:hypothetical protein